jgi:YaaC-like Protein
VARLSQPRAGKTLVVKGRTVPFSYFPVRKGARRHGLFDVVFAVSPWAVMQGAVNERTSSSQRAEGLAFLDQARAFYEAAEARTAASPLLSYYAFLNLGKALLRCLGYDKPMDHAMHGLSERRTGTGFDMGDSVVSVKDGGTSLNVFPELVERLGYPRPQVADVPVLDMASQVVVGHRLWREAAMRGERFVTLEDIEFMQDASRKRLWLRLWIRRGDLARYRITRKRLLTEGGLVSSVRAIDARPLGRDSELLCFEQKQTTSYSGRATDVLQDIVDDARPWLWRLISASPGGGYRKYYLHLTPASEQYRMPQIASLWMLMFYFGSVVRYRPQTFDLIAAGRYGAWASEFVAAQPDQLLYMLASEMHRREVTRPAIV